jgi:phage terminase small subunit
MSVLNNPRHERFCQFLARGKTATEAYQLAGYKPNRANAAQMAHKQHIRDRLTQINAELAQITQITVETLIEQADEIRRRAMESKQFSAAIAAIREMGMLSGVRIERKEIGQPGEFDHLSDDELERMLHEQILQFGYVPGPNVVLGPKTKQ